MAPTMAGCQRVVGAAQKADKASPRRTAAQSSRPAGYLLVEAGARAAYRIGSAPGMVDMVAGLASDRYAGATRVHRRRQVRVLGVAADKRLPQLPDVPTIQRPGLSVLDQLTTIFRLCRPTRRADLVDSNSSAAFNRA